MEFISAQGGKLFAGEEEILLRGFGLGGWLLPEGYMWQFYTGCDRPRRIEQFIESLCGHEYADSFWDRYLASYITEDDIRWIAGEGFNCVRLPLNARHLYINRNDGCDSLSAMIRHVDDLIGWCSRYGVYVILDMHAAPGGQTGQNIDDSEDDLPRLFIDPSNRMELEKLWKDIAGRYADEPAVAGYDLLNEPLPDQFSKYNDQVLPLYRELSESIRKVDARHIIILEGVHWATDFSIFDSLVKGEINNLVLQFHKYWNTPDRESLAPYIACAERLGTPLLMGEGGENNLAWYTTVFPLYKQSRISWSFWTYKKMGNENSPVSFACPAGWDTIITWLDGGLKPSQDTARGIFDIFLYEIAHSQKNMAVIRALKREVPLEIPCEAYDEYKISNERRPGALLREKDPVTLLFANGKKGVPDYRRYNGESQPAEENIIVELHEGEELSYRFTMSKCGNLSVAVSFTGDGYISICVDGCDLHGSIGGTCKSDLLSQGRHKLTILCVSRSVFVDTISMSDDGSISPVQA